MRVVVINKINRPEARAKEALRLIHDLLLELATDLDPLDFAVPYTSAQPGYVHRPGLASHGHAVPV